MKKGSVKELAYGGMTAALYVVLTLLAATVNLASGAIQVRFSEALTVMPLFTASAVPGLFLGCLLANLITGCHAMDVIFGSIATLIGAIGTRMLRKKPFLAWIPPVVSNMVVVPLVLRYAYGLEDALWFLVLTVGAGEVLSCGLLGMLLYVSLNRVPLFHDLRDRA